MRTLAGVTSEVVDPFRGFVEGQLSPPDLAAFQRVRLERFAASLGG